MSQAGWLFMALSCGFVVALVGYCYYKLLTSSSRPEHRQTRSVAAQTKLDKETK